MITLKDIRYVRLGTSSLDEAVRYAARILVLELVRRDRTNAYLRSDDRDHTLVYTLGNPREHAVAFEVASSAELDAAAGELDAADCRVRAGSRGECEQRWVDGMVSF